MSDFDRSEPPGLRRELCRSGLVSQNEAYTTNGYDPPWSHVATLALERAIERLEKLEGVR